MAAALMAAGAWAAAPQAATTHQRPAAAGTAKRPAAQPKLSDAQLEAVIRAKFAKSKINADKFTVRVQGGVATIDGKTDVVQHKGVGHADVQDRRGGGGEQSRADQRCGEGEGGGQSGAGPAPRAGQTRGCAQRAKVGRRPHVRHRSERRDKLGRYLLL